LSPKSKARVLIREEIQNSEHREYTRQRKELKIKVTFVLPKECQGFPDERVTEGFPCRRGTVQ
jgi:hypothetical protein